MWCPTIPSGKEEKQNDCLPWTSISEDTINQTFVDNIAFENIVYEVKCLRG